MLTTRRKGVKNIIKLMFIKYWTRREHHKIVTYEMGNCQERDIDFDNRYEFYNLLAARNFIKRSSQVMLEKYGKQTVIQNVEDPNL